jgi:uncharacterized repeat protein (TIGR01451 family)
MRAKHLTAVLLTFLALGALALATVTMAGPSARAASPLPSAAHQPQTHELGVALASRTSPVPVAPPPPAGEGVADTAVPSEIADVPGVTGDWWAAVLEQIRLDTYSLSPEQTEGGPPTYRGHNPDHGFDLTFAAGGVRLAPAADGPEGDGPETSWTWELRTTGYGYEGDVRPLPLAAETACEANRVEYRRAGMTEWYVNDERGLEQGFTINAPPAGDGDVLVLEMALDTGLLAALSGDPATTAGQAIEFRQPDGNAIVLRYSDLYAYDVAGRQLPAHMEWSGCGSGARPANCHLQLVIDVARAAYPLTIDPLIMTPDWTAVGENADDNFGYSVATAGDVNGDGFDDLVVGAKGYDGSRGKAYVYHGSPAGPGADPAWTAVGENADDNFGWSVARAGDVNGDGYDDLVAGAWGYEGPEPGVDYGKTYVYHGSPAGLGDTAAWTAVGEGISDGIGASVATAGDVNGDGYDDLVVGAEGYPGGIALGLASVYHGSPAGLGDTAAWTKAGDEAGDFFATSVATAGDVNGDGYSDLAVGATGYLTDVGRVYVYYGSAEGLVQDAGPDWMAAGEHADDRFGASVATAGDVNGDGFADLVVGALGYDGPAPEWDYGKAYVYHGSQNGLPQDAVPDWTAVGVKAWDSFGDFVATAGDVNGDGYADIVVGAQLYDDPTNGKENAGQAYVYHGSPAGLGSDPDWTAVGESAYDHFGASVATAGDVNGDGYDDLVIGAHGYDDPANANVNAGRACLYHGSALGLNPTFDWTAGGENAYDHFGYAVATAGDVNGDGFADLVVGAPYNDDTGTDAGKAYVYHGSPAGLGSDRAWTAVGEQAGNRFGYSVATAGDLNGDGFADLVVGAPYNDDNGTSAGKAYVYLGSESGLRQDAMPDWTATGVNDYDNFGACVATAGDVNGDRHADLVVGATGYPQGNGNGKAYVYHGSADGLGAAAAWTASGEHASDHFASAVGTAGDVNSDGYADLVAGAWGYGTNAGKVYVYHGSASGLNPTFEWAAMGENAYDYFGWSVGTAGDVNGDGYADVAAGAWGYDDAGNSDAGRVDLYRGGSAGISTTGAISIAGQSAGEHFGYSVGTAGDVNGDGYADVLVGAQGDQNTTGKAYLYGGAADGLATAPDWSASGRRGGDHFGAVAAAAGDVNGDGYSDLAVGAWGYDDPANTNAGRAYVYHGTAAGLGGTPWTAVGENESDWFAWSVATAGDVNGDGYADVVVGAWEYDDPEDAHAGRAYVYQGAAQGLGGAPAWTATGDDAYRRLGVSAACAGDVNGDGYADLAVSAAYGDAHGEVYVYHGSAEGLVQDAPPDWTASGENAGDHFGYAVGTAGDVNGDGYADLVVGVDGYDDAANGTTITDTGRVYVYHGSAMGLGDTPAWTAVGENANDHFGYSVSTAGDVNGDGFADLVVAAAGYLSDTGRTYVYHGSPAGLGETPAWTAVGENAGDSFGESVATAGDVNGDGYADVVVLAPYRGFLRGRAYVYHGSAHGLDVPFSTFSGGEVGTVGEGGISSVAGAGDVNGDGFADLVVGAASAFTTKGRVYVYRGTRLGLSPTFDPVAVGENDVDYFGFSVATAGDVNGDGYADVVVGAIYNDDGGYDAGKAYVFQGNDGGGRAGLARQARGDGSGKPVQPWGPSYTADSFGVSLQAVDPLGRGRARLQVQACPPGVPFGDAACLEQTADKWIEASSDGGVELSHIVPGLEEGELHRWRARALYGSPLYGHGPWRRLMGQAMEADVRSTRLPADLSLTKTMDPADPVATGNPITYTITFASNGPARGVVITDILPSDITDIHISSSGAAISPTGSIRYVWAVQDLEAGEGGVITITALAQAERFVNTATITGTSPDPNPANNSATVQTHISGTLYVNGDASGAGTGLSWANAYTDLQDALAEAKSGDQIWVAEGVYRPVASVLRSSSFHLVTGTALHGGFSGSESWLHERDPAAHPTVLSGDIGTVGNPDDNAFHVVTASSGVTETTVLEGVIITGGNADQNGDDGWGGGLFNQGGSPTLINVALIGNAATQGGGMYNAEGSHPTLVNVAFSGNTATEGGGMYNLSSSPILSNTTFSNNVASTGGAIHNQDSAPTVINSILWGNTPDQISNAISTTVSYSDIEGGCPADADCTGVVDDDPQFTDADGPDDIAGTLDDDLRLHTTYRQPNRVIDQGNNTALPPDTFDLDGDGDTAERIPLDLSGRWRIIAFTDTVPTVDMGAYEATIVDVLAEGESLFQQGEAFRQDNLQLLSSDTLADALKNYANFNDGEWYDAFCGDYGQIDEHGYCPQGEPQAVRNVLLDAVDLYRVAVGYPAEVFGPYRGDAIAVWEAGSQGVLSSATEIANVHLIFGNEFLVDATDYRFSTAGIPYADQIIAQELDELGQAQLQFELIMDMIFRAFNEWGVGDYCSSDQFEQFGVASSLLVSTLNETAARYYMLRQSEAALDVYVSASNNQYLQAMALAEMATASGEEYLQNGSWEMLNNLSQLRERAQAIHDGLDFFGFAPEYVPLQAYEQLLLLTEGPTGNSGLLGTARDLEDQARDAQRTFDANASDMATELDNLTVELNGQLFELCGASEDDYETCEGGLMEQNLDAWDAASLRVGLAYLRAQNIAEQIQIEADRAGQVINVHLAEGQIISAAELAIGKLQARRTTRVATSSSEDQFHAGYKAKAEAYVQTEISWSGIWPEAEFKAGVRASLEAVVGYQHAWTWSDSTETVWDPAAEAIAHFESLQALKQAEAQAEIEGANSAAAIRNLLLQESEALEEYDIALAELNKVAAEGNYLAQRSSRLLNRRHQAINRVASHNSHLLSPAYRIWRDSLTTQSMQAHALAAQFAYLTARAAEYELLTPYPDLGQIFRARTSNDIRLFLDGLKVWVQALDLPGQLNRYPYTLSLARDLWGLTDQALDPDGALSEEELHQERYEEFQTILQDNLDAGRLEFWFGTTLDQQRAEQQYLFSPNIWNNRIAGIGAPLAQSEGVWINIVTRQSDDVGDPEVVLIHGGWAGGAEAYRNAAGQLVYYDPDTAVPVGYVLPAELDPANTTAVLRPGINGAGAIPNSALMNLSVAASTWTFRIPAESRGDLDYSQIEDIEIVMDTTGRALAGQAEQAERDALRLQAGLPMEPVEIEWAVKAPAAAAGRLAQGAMPPIIAGAIGGPYFGNVVVTSPLSLTVQVLNLDLWNDGGTVTGTVNVDETSLYSGDIGLDVVTVGDEFTITTSAPFTTVVAGRTVTQAFTLVGQAEEEGDVLKAAYTGTIESLLPDPILVQGTFSASRPGAPASERLSVQAGAWTVQPGASTPVTATLYDETMALITETRRITFTADLGTVVPTSTDTVDGEAVVTFTAGGTLGQAEVWATTGEITGVVRIQVSEMEEPQAGFAASPLSGTFPLTVTYTDLSLGMPTGWSWDFGDGTTSKEQHPSHTYTAIGSYTVSLTASNPLGVATATEPNYISVTEPTAPVADFSASPRSGVVPLTVAFEDQSACSPTHWAWDFGDGAISAQQHPTHTYTAIGSYTVTLTVSNTLGSDTLSEPNYISVINSAPALGAVDPSSGSGPTGVTTYFTTTWTDASGWEDLKHCYFHIGDSPSIVGNVTLLYNAAKNKLWLRTDDGSAWTGGYLPGTDNTLENSQAIVDCNLTTAEGSGDTLTVKWAIEFKPGYTGTKKLGLKCKDRSKAKAKGKWKGTWTIE